MHIALCALSALIVASVPVGSWSPAGGAPLPDAVRTSLLEAGYCSVPLLETKSGLGYAIVARIGGEPLTLGVDTGASRSVMGGEAGMRLRLDKGEEFTMSTPTGDIPAHQVRLDGLMIGTHRWDFALCMLADISRAGKLLRVGDKAVDGLIGHDFLRRNSALIDYPGRVVYLRSPEVADFRPLRGDWRCSRTEKDGEVRAAGNPDLAGFRMRVGLERIELTTRHVTQTFFPFVYSNDENGPRVGLLYKRTGPNVDGPPGERMQVAYDYDGRRFRLMLRPKGGEPIAWSAVPRDFRPADHPGWGLMEFERDGPAPPAAGR